MAFRKRTLRIMSPTARKVARLAGEAESVATRLNNLIPELQTLDAHSKALTFATQQKPFTDSDLWGILNAIIHGQQDGYFNDNKKWAETMVNRINDMRKPLFEA